VLAHDLGVQEDRARSRVERHAVQERRDLLQPGTVQTRLALAVDTAGALLRHEQVPVGRPERVQFRCGDGMQGRQRLTELGSQPVALRRREVGPSRGEELAVQALHEDVTPALELAGAFHPRGRDRQPPVDGRKHVGFDLVAVVEGTRVELEHSGVADGVDRQESSANRTMSAPRRPSRSHSAVTPGSRRAWSARMAR
jgi:hypothetical protein